MDDAIEYIRGRRMEFVSAALVDSSLIRYKEWLSNGCEQWNSCARPERGKGFISVWNCDNLFECSLTKKLFL